MRIVAFFNNKGGVGKTTLVYHLAWMFAERGVSVLAVDLDPQANLTSMFLEEDRLEELWPKDRHRETIQGVVNAMLRGTGDIGKPHVEPINRRIGLLAGDLALSGFEGRLADAWPRCHKRDESALRVTTAFYRASLMAAKEREADLILFDVGPNLGAASRSAVISSDYVVIPLAADLLSPQGLRSMGPQLRSWRQAWRDLCDKSPYHELLLPSGSMEPLGYIVTRRAIRSNRPSMANIRWMERIPEEYDGSVLGSTPPRATDLGTDPNCLAILRHYRSLMPLSMESRKPMFFLKPADGAIGAHVEAVRDCYRDFDHLAQNIAHKCGLELPQLTWA